MTQRRSAVVTGSTSGIGLGIAEALAEAGLNVMLNGFGDRNLIEAHRVRIADTYGVDTDYSDADMTVPPTVHAMIERTRAAFHTTRAALDGMKSQGWGRIINIASAHALVASPFKAAYVAAKHGLLGLTKTVALEAAEHGVTVNAICPGYVKTPLVERQIPDTARARGMTEQQVRDVLLASQPTRRFVQVEEIGKLAVFLCSDAAASINGAALPIDGGWVAQ